MFRDVGYARLSHSDPDEDGAIARQKQDIARVSNTTGGELVGPILVDNAVSASRYARKKRKDYPKLLDLARAGAIDRAVIYDVDRLLRIPRELEDLIDLIENLEGRFSVVAVNGEMDLSTADGRFFARMRVAQAAKESDDTSRRLRRAALQAAERGQPHSGRGRSRTFGYGDDGVTLIADEAEAIRSAAADVLAGETLSAVARRWNDAGWRTPRTGSRWENRTVRSVLIGRRAAGLRVYREGHRDEQVFTAVWPAIIDEVTHRALRRQFIDQPEHRPGRRTEYTGLFVTASGRAMRRDRNQNRGIYRTYRRWPGEEYESITVGPAAELEALVAEMLFVAVESGEIGARIAARRAAKPAGEDPSVVEAELVQLAEDEASGLMTRAEWLTKRKVLEPRLRAAQIAEAAATANHALAGVEPDVRARWALPEAEGGYSTDRKRAILAAVFDRVEIAPAPRMGPGFDPSRVNPIWRD